MDANRVAEREITAKQPSCFANNITHYLDRAPCFANDITNCPAPCFSNDITNCLAPCIANDITHCLAS